MYLGSFKGDPGVTLKRYMATSENSLERSEVLVLNDMPTNLKLNKTKELFEVKSHYGYWNPSSVPHH